MIKKIGDIVGRLAIRIAKKSVNSASANYCYQPQIPQKLMKQTKEKTKQED